MSNTAWAAMAGALVGALMMTAVVVLAAGAAWRSLARRLHRWASDLHESVLDAVYSGCPGYHWDPETGEPCDAPPPPISPGPAGCWYGR